MVEWPILLASLQGGVMGRIRVSQVQWLISCCFIFLVILGCGGSSGSGGGDDSSEEAEEEDITVECDGATGGDVASEDGGFSVDIPTGSVTACLNIYPNVSNTSDISSLAEDDEVIVSAAYVLALNTENAEDVDASDEITLEMEFDDTTIPAADLDALHVYANMAFEDENGDEVVIPVFGSINNGVFTATVTGLYDHSTWVVVYDPNMESTIFEDNDSDDNVSASVSGLTDEPDFFGDWNQNDWCVLYKINDPTLRTTIATALGTTAAALTTAQMSNFLKTQVSEAAKVSGMLYGDGGFREPDIQVQGANQPAVLATCTNTKAAFYNIMINGSSRYTNPVHAGRVNTAGILYIGSSEVNDQMASALGSTFDAVAHEMFHSILAGYDIVVARNVNGINEGGGATFGHTMGWNQFFGRIGLDSADWDDMSGTYVRTASNSEIFLLSNRLFTLRLANNTSENYSNQDFIAYVANATSKKLDYFEDVLAGLYSSFTTIANKASTDIPGYQAAVGYSFRQINESISSTFSSLFGLDLAKIYMAFVVDRAYGHSAAAKLRNSDPDTAGITTSLFAAVAQVTESIDPEDLDDATFEETGSFAAVSPYSARLLTITASASVTDKKRLKITLADHSGLVEVGEGAGRIQAVTRGDSDQTLSASSVTIANFGDTVNTLYVLIANTSDTTITIDYTLSSGGSSIPELTVSGCPLTVESGSSTTFDIGYKDADGDIETLTQVTNFNGDISTATGDAKDLMPGTEGTYEAPATASGTFCEDATVTATVTVKDGEGNTSNAISCTIHIPKNADCATSSGQFNNLVIEAR